MQTKRKGFKVGGEQSKEVAELLYNAAPNLQSSSKVNEDTISFLLKANIPIREADDVQEARSRRRQQTREHKADANAYGGGRPSQQNIKKPEPIKSDKIGRNEIVTVQYEDGQVKKGVKYKVVEQDVKNGHCVVTERSNKK